MTASETRLDVLEREHAEFYERWHEERRKREKLELLIQQVLADAQAQDVLAEWWPMMEVIDTNNSQKLFGPGTNPRYLLWQVWHGDNQNMRLWDYTQWSDTRWTEFCTEEKRNLRMLSKQDQSDYDAWLRHWVRREIAHM